MHCVRTTPSPQSALLADNSFSSSRPYHPIRPMKTLLILRHAKSSWKDDGLTDHDRPLNKRGKRNAPV